jgi:glycosyltransferase involved in cell wall biosynthesis
MDILYDSQIFSLQKYGGISRYHSELISRFKKYPDVNILIPRMIGPNYYMGRNDIFADLFYRCNFRGKYRFVSLVNSILLKNLILNNDFDVFHPTYYDPYFLKIIKDKPFVITVHDMIHEKFPELLSKNDVTIKNKKELIIKAHKIIAVSHNTKQDIIDIIGVDSKKIDVIYHGYKLIDNPIPILLNIPQKFILYVGHRWGYKNFERFAKAFAKLHTKIPDLNLICTGNPFSRSEERMMVFLGIEGAAKTVAVNDTELAILYKNAKLFVFPSLYEGFGLPILEAMALGCPTALSNSSCFPEIAEDAAEYFDPYDEASIFKAMESVLFSAERQNELICRGIGHVKKFSWEKTAEQTMQVYKNI